MSRSTGARSKAGIVAAAPVLLLAASLYHPHLPGRLPNHAAIAAAVAADTTRWALSHLSAAVASGILIVAFLAVRSHLRGAGEERWSAPALAFVAMGSTLYAVLPGMEFAPLAAVEMGTDAAAAQAALQSWFLPVLLTAALTFAMGAVGFAIGILRSGVLDPPLARIVAGCLIVMAASRFVPLAAVQFYVQGVAGLGAFWPLAYVIWKAPETVPAPGFGRAAAAT